MAEQLQERSQIAEEYLWDLTKMFPDKEAWEVALAEITPLIEQVGTYQGTLGEGPEKLREYFDLIYSTDEKMNTIYGYAFQTKSQDTRQDVAQDMMSRAQSRYVQFIGAMSFADPELLELPEEQLNAYLKAECLAPYRHVLENTIRGKAHTLSAAEEAVIAAYGEISGAGGDVANMLMDADMTFDSIPNPENPEEQLPVTSSNYILLQSNTDRRIREASFRSFYKGFQSLNNTFATTYQTQVKEDALNARLRHYSSSRAMSLAANNIPESVYDSLVETVHKHMPTMYRYVALRKKLLDVDELHYYDLYAPLTGNLELRYTFDEAKEMLLKAIEPLGADYTSIVKRGLADRWIDVYPNVGKSSGAYSIGSKKDTPFIMMNFTGTLDSVSTLCHEMGHSIHTYLSNENQPAQYSDYALFIAEVASTVNENLLIERLLSENPDKEMKLYLLNQYLESFKATVFRQTMFAEFEKLAHDRIEAGEALSASTLNNMYRDLIAQYFGPELVIDDEVQYEWSRIPHFYRSFYVYQYATGYSSAVALSEAILTEGEPAVKRYLEFLSMGSSVYPMEALAHGGVDLSTPAPVDRALEKFDRILTMAEELIAE